MSPERNPRLEPYRKKRDPARTPEPFGDADDDARRRSGAPIATGRDPAARRAAFAASLPGPQFVVQKHWATSMHYDLRLELGGTLVSWAVPKGPSTHVEEKRLAVHVEDHPMDYADFEGVIPAKNYGAGSVIVWDRGWWGSFKPEPIDEQYERGKLELELHGFKLRGRWTLVRMGGRNKSGKEWLLLKKAGGGASEREAVDVYPESVITGLTVEEMKDVAGTIDALRDRVESLKPPRRDLPKDVPFMLATLSEKTPAGMGWGFEIKYDGVRVLARRDGDDVRLTGRSGRDITERYPEVTLAIRGLAVPEFVVDGEIVAEDENGRPSFQRLQARMHLSKPRDIARVAKAVPVRGMFFDCLSLLGHDLRGLPLERRKELLARVLPPIATVQRVDHIVGHGPAFFDAANEMGLEGIMAKKLTSPYSGRRSPEWLKVKCQRRQEFVIGGYTEGQGARSKFGALHVGVYQDGKLVYVTKVGTGLDDATITTLMKGLAPLARASSPFEVDSPGARGNHWVDPKLVCDVRFTEWTREGGLRHPTFMGLRTDVKPEDVRREEAIPAESDAEEAAGEGAEPEDPGSDAEEIDEAPEPARAAPKAKSAARSSPEKIVKLTNLKKIFWPDGTTKGELIAYYETVAPLMLPYLRDRPIVLTRYPDGIEGKSFFQKDAPVYVPDWVRTETIPHEERDIRYFVVDDLESLRYIANMGTIPIHAWGARVGALENPDWLVIDLDPKSAPFTDVVKVARVVHDLLAELEIPGYPKTSGATGLHILIPMGQQYTDDEVKTFARILATMVVEQVPDIATITRTISARGGKVYVDFGQNGYGITIVAPFSVRPVPAASASCPLRWDEVNGRLDPANFTIRTIPQRFREMEDPLAPVLGEGIDMAAAIARIEERMRKKAKKK